MPLVKRLGSGFPLFALLMLGCGSPDARDAVLQTEQQAPVVDIRELDVLEQLRAIPGLNVTEVQSQNPDYRFFRMRFLQPVDHNDPAGPNFEQRLTLLHRGADRPMVYSTQGYFLSQGQGRTELTRLLDANQLAVEHRFFAESRPEPTDWSKLTIEQSAADHHDVAVAFKAIYAQKWVNTGASKGGMTALYHRRFYPDDVDATVAYVAPSNQASPDMRYPPFLDAVGPNAECRARLKDFQRIALSARDALLTRLDSYAARTGETFEILGKSQALEHAVIETPFVFWQYGRASGCSAIPTEGASADSLFSYLEDNVGFGYVADDGIRSFEPFYFQSGNQLGYPGYDDAHLNGLLQFPGSDNPDTYASVETHYDPNSAEDVRQWVKTQGRSLLFIYGAYDPWTAGAYELGDAQDSFRFMQPEGNHGSNLAGLTEADRAQALGALERWLNVPLLQSVRARRTLASKEAQAESNAISEAAIRRFRL